MSGINKGSIILLCTCKNAFQDERYGQGKRVHNYCKNPYDKGDMKGARCTVCGKVKSL